MKLQKKDFIQLSGDLYTAVQSSGIFKDSKTFVDSIPKNDPEVINNLYKNEKIKQNFLRGLRLPGRLVAGLVRRGGRA